MLCSFLLYFLWWANRQPLLLSQWHVALGAQWHVAAKELSKTATGKTLYLLDEPTTGLHFHDVSLLLNVLQKLKSQGNTVVIIEHNLDVIKNSDWIVDIGPEGGKNGGNIIAQGTPEEIMKEKGSYTGLFLKDY